MSLRHTKGRIKAKLTDLMLEAGRYRMASRITACGSAFSAAGELAVAQANARRLAACWNWCEGLDTEGLEQAVAISRPAQAMIDDNATEQRRLHAANRDCMAWFESAKRERDTLLTALENARSAHLSAQNLDLSEIEAAIAGAKGGSNA